MFSKNSSSGRKPETNVSPSQTKTPPAQQAAAAPISPAPPQVTVPPAANPSSSGSVPSIISKDLRVEGNLISSGELQVDGSIKGDIKGTDIVVGDSGEVNGNVVADSVRVAGKLNGSIEAKQVALDQSARVTGDLRHDDLAIASGAQFEGSAVRRAAKSQTPSAAAASSEADKSATGSPDKKPDTAPSDKKPDTEEQASAKLV